MVAREMKWRGWQRRVVILTKHSEAGLAFKRWYSGTQNARMQMARITAPNARNARPSHPTAFIVNCMPYPSASEL